jgi:protein involved in polysaccharide export with SLBB domain
VHLNSNVELYENIIENNRSVDFAVLDSILGLRLDNTGMLSVAIDLKKAMENPGSDYDIVLRDGDVLNVPEYISTVKVQGEVKYPTALNWKKGKTVKYYVNHAGGFRRAAKKNGIYVINMNGSIERVSRFSRKVEPGSTVVVPRNKIRRSVSAGEIITIGTTTVSLATMIATLLNALGK